MLLNSVMFFLRMMSITLTKIKQMYILKMIVISSVLRLGTGGSRKDKVLLSIWVIG